MGVLVDQVPVSQPDTPKTERELVQKHWRMLVPQVELKLRVTGLTMKKKTGQEQELVMGADQENKELKVL